MGGEAVGRASRTPAQRAARIKKGTADIREETADLLRAYRLCLQRYEAEPPQAKEYCGPYTQSLREIDIKRETLRREGRGE